MNIYIYIYIYIYYFNQGLKKLQNLVGNLCNYILDKESCLQEMSVCNASKSLNYSNMARYFTHFIPKLFGFLVLSRSQRCFCIMHYSGTEQAMSQMEDILKCSFGFKREHKETTQNILPPLQKYRS